MPSATCRADHVRRGARGARAVARSQLSERCGPAHEEENWQTYAETLAALGEADRAAEARKRGQAAVEAGA